MYNAKRGSEPSKTFDFSIDLSWNVDVFSEPSSRHHFSRVKAPVYAHKYDFEPTFDFPTVPKPTLAATFSAQGSTFGVNLSRADRPGANLGTIWRRKRSKDALSSICGHFLREMLRNLEKMGSSFHDFLMIVNTLNITSVSYTHLTLPTKRIV